MTAVTRVTGNDSSLLDPIYVSNVDILYSVGIRDTDAISDHRITYCKIKLPASKNVKRFVTFKEAF